ncbi:MAG: isoprenylcysteine carboxylmethyltransferase family protein [Candidatus Dormibacteraceae bacterium]
MPRIFAFLYGLICYVTFFFTFLYAIGFVENLYVPKAIDAMPTASLGQALLIDAILLGVFALQHSVMARQGFKETWTKIVPKPVERSTYVLFASLALLLLFWKWEPIGGVVWEVRSQPARLGLQSLSLVGWLIVLVSTFLINHFELFGLRQVFSYLRGVQDAPPEFKTPAFYNYVRHPIYFGFIIAFWATPTMSIAHFVFAAATTGYMLIAIQLEERDLVRFFGSRYEAYKGQVSMLIPRPPKRGSQPSAPGSRLGST